MQIQYEIPIFMQLQKPLDEPIEWVRQATFEDCVKLAFARATGKQEPQRMRTTQKILGTNAGIYPPHVSDVANGKRPLKAECVDRLCWLSGCNAPRQWLDLRRDELVEQFDNAAKELVWQQFRKAAA